jgi:hypothetical protein
MQRTASEARAWAHKTPDNHGATWSQCCQAFIVRALGLTGVGDAIDALNATTMRGTDHSDAPEGALHWWRDAAKTVGHVGIQLAGDTVLMTDAPDDDQWPQHNTVGDTRVVSYNAKGNGFSYVGWSTKMASQKLVTSPRRATGTRPGSMGHPKPAPKPSRPHALPKTRTAVTGIPDANYRKRLQLFARANGYRGPVNGILFKKSWNGIQSGLRQFGYTKDITGAPDRATMTALQRLAVHGGYEGPINGALGKQSYRGIATWLNAQF